MTAIVENVSAPVRMLTFSRIVMFIKRRAVESSERKGIFRKMRRHPIHDHTDTLLVKVIDQKAKIVGRTVSRRRSKIGAYLITPRRSVRVLFERQELDVSKPVFKCVVSQQRGHFAISQRTIVLLRN